MWTLSLEGVTKRFGDFELKPLTLSIAPGEFFSLLGPSGCGKTTVLRLIGGFERCDKGQIVLGDSDITQLPPNKRNIHTVFQKYALFPHLNVFNNVAFSLRLKKTAPPDLNQRVGEALELVEISHLRDRPIHSLSGGQSQRVALARALIDRPAILLLDEPLSALDPALRGRMREELKSLCRKVGSTFIFVTHDQEEALQLSDRIAILKNGHCLQVGTPKSLYEDPVDAFVANFIGPTNEIPGDIQEDQGETYLSSRVGRFKIKLPSGSKPQDSLLTIRPEKMRLLRQKSNTSDNILDGQIQEVSYLGSRTEYVVSTESVTFRVFELELERQKKRLLNRGDKVYLSWKPEDGLCLPRTVESR